MLKHIFNNTKLLYSLVIGLTLQEFNFSELYIIRVHIIISFLLNKLSWHSFLCLLKSIGPVHFYSIFLFFLFVSFIRSNKVSF